MANIDTITLNETSYFVGLPEGAITLTPGQKQTLMEAINSMGAFNRPDGADVIAAFNEAWNTTITGITLNKSSTIIDGGGYDTLTATLVPSDAVGTITWSSSNTSIATVNASGRVTAVADGNCTITASCAGVTATCAVTCTNTPEVFSITLNLTNCSATNTQTTVLEGSSYSTGFISDSGYEIDTVTCTMGGVAQTVTDNTVSIANVTGAIVITATAITAPTYTSGNGLSYTKSFTFELASPTRTMAAFFTLYGAMEHLEELTIIGDFYSDNAAGIQSTEIGDIATNAPGLKRLIINPSSVSGKNSLLRFGHYCFNTIPASLTYLQLSGVNQTVYFGGGGYFRDNGTAAGLSNKYMVGNTNGLELVLYTDSYRANGGFGSSTLAPTTTLKEYLYTDGSELTA